MSERSPRLAVVAPDLGGESVTFFRHHIRAIHPGRTVVVHLSSDGAPARLDVPVLDIVRRPAWPETGLPLLRTAIRQLNVWRAHTLDAGQRAAVSAFFEAHGVTHVFAEFATSGVTIAPVARALKLPLAVMSHGWDINVLGRTPQFRARYRTLYAPDVQLIANGPFLKERMVALGAPAANIRAIPCAVEAKSFEPARRSPDGRVRLAMVSRLAEQKGPLLSLRAFARAARARPDLELDIVGSGPLLSAVREAVEAQELGARVRVHGALDHEAALGIMSRCDIFLQHCVTIEGQGIEAQGVSLLEAMAREAVPIVTRHGAMARHIDDGVNGWLVDEHDVELMATRILEMAEAPDRRHEIGREARRFVIDNFDPVDVNARMRDAIGLPPEC